MNADVSPRPALAPLFAPAGSTRDARAVRALLRRTELSEPRLEYLRYKPGLSAVARVVGAAGTGSAAQPWWFAAYAPAAAAKAGKIVHRAQRHGYPLYSATLPDQPGTWIHCGPLGLDRQLFRVLASEHAVDSRGRLRGTVLSYNPWRRVVFGRVDAAGRPVVLRVWADRPAGAALLPALHDLGAPVLPVHRLGEHVVEHPWVRGEDLARVLGAAERDARLPDPAVLRATAEVLARLHRIGPATLAAAAEGGVNRLPEVTPAAALKAAGDGVCAYLAGHRGAFEDAVAAVLDTVRRCPEAPVVAHGDFSADQVVLDAHGTPVLIDLDRVMAAPACYDLGSFAAVELLAGRSGDTARALVHRYRQVRGPDAAPHAAVLAWAAFHVLLRVGESFRALDPDCVADAGRRIRLARHLLTVQEL